MLWNRRIALLLVLLTALGISSAPAAEPAAKKSYPTLGSIERLDPRLDLLVPRNARIEVLASGYDWIEGPVWVKEGGYLLFSEIPSNSIYKWKEGEGEGISKFMSPSGFTGVGAYGKEPGSNGLLIDPLGRLVCCEHGDRRVSMLTKQGGKRTLVDNYQGKRLNSPNDGAFKSNGDLYFTDPPYGLPRNWDDPARELDFCGVYRLAANGKLTLLTEEMTRPNGIAFSPDEKTLYVAQSDPKAAVVKTFSVHPDGMLGPSKVLFDRTAVVGKLKGLPDGMKVDVQGNLFATAPGGVLIYAPDGTHLGTLAIDEATSNCAWGDDGSSLYITADMYLCRIRLTTKGNRF